MSEQVCERRTSPYPLFELAFQVVDLVPQAGGVLEAEFGGGFVHFLFEGSDEPAQLVLGQLGQIAADPVAPAVAPVLARDRSALLAPQRRQDVGDRLADRLGVDAVVD